MKRNVWTALLVGGLVTFGISLRVSSRVQRDEVTNRAEPARPSPSREQARSRIDSPTSDLDALSGWKSEWAGAPDSVAREQVLVKASKLGTGAAVRWLATVAGSDARLGARAAAALGQIANHDAAPELDELARGDGLVIVRANAARALGTSGTKRDAPLLVALVEDPREPWRVRQEAALSVGRIGDDDSVPGLARTLGDLAMRRDSASEQLRLSIIQALGSLGTRSARTALERHRRDSLSPLEQAFLERALSPAQRKGPSGTSAAP